MCHHACHGPQSAQEHYIQRHADPHNPTRLSPRSGAFDLAKVRVGPGHLQLATADRPARCQRDRRTSRLATLEDAGCCRGQDSTRCLIARPQDSRAERILPVCMLAASLSGGLGCGRARQHKSCCGRAGHHDARNSCSRWVSVIDDPFGNPVVSTDQGIRSTCVSRERYRALVALVCVRCGNALRSP